MYSQPIKGILRYNNVDCYALHTPTTRKKGCVTRPDLSGVPLTLLHKTF